jgi:hypothetical protein
VLSASSTVMAAEQQQTDIQAAKQQVSNEIGS